MFRLQEVRILMYPAVRHLLICRMLYPAFRRCVFPCIRPLAIHRPSVCPAGGACSRVSGCSPFADPSMLFLFPASACSFLSSYSPSSHVVLFFISRWRVFLCIRPFRFLTGFHCFLPQLAVQQAFEQRIRHVIPNFELPTRMIVYVYVMLVVIIHAEIRGQQPA